MKGHFACLVFVLPGILAGPVLQSTCASECLVPSNPKFTYEVGKAYVYNYQATTETAITGTSKDNAVVTLNGVATVGVLTPCDFTLQLSKTKVQAADEKVDVSALEKRSLLFAFRDGVVESICPFEDEPVYVLNIKKAILSLLQHTPDSLNFADSTVETDIAGRCPTNYTVDAKGAILKTRDLTQCSNRLGRFSAVPTVAYTTPAQLQTAPILKSASECRMVVTKGIVQSSQCIETHLLRPLSSVAGGGAQTKVVVSLSYQSAAKASSFKPSSLNQDTLLFDSTLPELGTGDKEQVALVAKDICKALNADTPDVVPGLFSQLVHAVRRAGARDLKAAHTDIAGRKNCKDVSGKIESLFFDALINAGTPGAVTYMAQLINEGKVSDARARSFYVHLHFTKYPSKEVLKALYVLIDKPTPIPQSLIGISGYARRVCESLGSACVTDTEIQVLTVKLVKHLSVKCKAKDVQEEKKILGALKALGNIGAGHKDVFTTVKVCVQDSTLPVPTRLAAVQAFRSRPCDVTDFLLEVLADQAENVEVRVAAYLGAMKCPSYAVMKKVQAVLEKEQVNQVGSFIQSHLGNIKNNPNPGKQELRKFVRSINVDRSFPFDFRKFSRNLEIADFCPINNAGWDLDANIVYAPDSYLPKSAALNVTLDMFGQSVNLFEIGGRFEGLEYLVESYFGPEGIYAENVASTAGDRLAALNGKIQSRFGSLLRPKRAAPINKADVDAIVKVAGLDKAFYASPKGDFFLRLFGAEVATMSHRRGNEAPNSDLLLDKVFDVLNKLIDGAKNYQVDVARSVMFLDRISTFPTAAGLPLRLALNGTASLALDFESQIDIRAILRDPKTASVALKVVPMTAAEISAAMAVDINTLRFGVKTVVNLQSSRGAGIKMSVSQGKGFELSLELPKTKMTLIEAKSELSVFRQTSNGVEKKQKIAVLNPVEYKRGACIESVSTLLGLRYCRQYTMQVPSAPTAVGAMKDLTPIFPLSGHFLGSIFVEKTEPSMTGIFILASATTTGASNAVEFTFDTPGSTTDRKIVFKGTAFSSNTRYGFEGKAKRLGKDYEAKLYADLARSSTKLDISPVVEYTLADGKKDVLVAGRITIEQGKKLTFNIAPAGSLKNVQLGASGSAEFEFSADVRKVALREVQITTPLGKSGFTAVYGRDHHSIDSSLELIYGQNNKVGFVGKVTDKSRAPLREYVTEVGFKSTRFPFLSFHLDYNFKKTEENLENEVVFVYGAESEAKVNRLALKQFRKRRGSFATKDLVIENKIEASHPGRNFDFKVDQSLNYYPQKLDARLKVDYSGKSLLAADLLADIRRDLKTVYDAKVKIEYPGRKIEIFDNMQQVSEHIYKTLSSVQLKPGPKYEILALNTYDKRSDHLKVEVDAEVKSDYNLKPYKLKSSLLLKDKYAFVTKNRIEGDGAIQFLLDGRFDPTAAEPELVVDTNILGRFEGRVSGKLGRSEKTFEFGAYVPRFDRKIMLTALARTGGEFRRVEGALAWDALKDKTKQVSFEVSARLPPTEVSADIRAGLKVIENKYTAGFAGTLGKGFYADHTGRFELELPGLKKAVVGARASNAKQNDKVTVKGGVEASLPNGEEYRFDFDNRVSDIDLQSLTLSAQSDVKFNTPQTRDGLLHVELSRKINTAGIRVSNARFTFAAPRLGNNIDGNVNLEVASDSYKVTATGQRGPAFFSVDSNGKITKVGNKINVNGVVEVKAPRMDWKEIKVSLISSNEYQAGKFDYNEKINVFYGMDKNLAFEAKASNMRALEATVSLETPYPGAKSQLVSATYNRAGEKHDGVLTVQYSPADRPKTEIKTNFLLSNAKDSFAAKIATTTPYKEYDQIEFSVDGRVTNAGKTYDADVRAGISAARNVKVTAKVDLQAKSKLVDVAVIAQGQSPLKFYTSLNEGADYKFDSRVDFLGKYITASGSGKVTSIDAFDIKGLLDSPAYNINKYEVILTNKPDKKKANVVDIVIKKGGSNIGTVKLAYEKKDSRSTVEINGKLDFDLKNIVGNTGGATFKLQDKSRAEYTATFDLTGDLAGVQGGRKVSYVIKNTVKERSFLRNSCINKKECTEHTVAFKDGSGKSDQNYEINLLAKNFVNKKDVTSGFTIKYKNGTEFENSVEYYFDKESKKLIGYKIYASDIESGVELYTAKRTIAANAVFESKSRVFSSAVKQKMTYSVWLDKKGRPNKKLSLYLATEPHKLDDMDGVTFKVSLRHPAMKDLDITGEIHQGGKTRLYHGKLDVDVVSNIHKRLVLEGNVVKADIKNGANYTYDFTLASQGKDLSMKVNGFRTVTSTSRAGTAYLTLKDGKVENILLTKYELTDKDFAVKVGRPDRQMGLSVGYNKIETATVPRYTFDASTSVLGLAPTIYSVEVTPFEKAEARVYNNATPENHIYLFAGLENEQTFDISVQHNKAGLRNEVLLTKVVLTNPRILHTVQQFDKTGLQSLVQTIRNRRLAVMDEFQKRTAVLTQELKSFTAQFAAFEGVPGVVDKVVADYKGQVVEFKKDLDKDESLKETAKVAREGYTTVSQLTGVVASTADDLTNKLEKALEEAKKRVIAFVNSLPELYRRTYLDVLDAIEHLVVATRNVIGHLIPTTEYYANVVTAMVDEKTGIISAVKNAYVNLSGKLTELFSEVQSFVSEKIEKLVKYVKENAPAGVDGTRASESLKKFFEIISDPQKLRQAIYQFLENNVFSQYDLVRSEFVKAYPEFTRPVYRLDGRTVSLLRERLRAAATVTPGSEPVSFRAVVRNQLRRLGFEMIRFDLEGGVIDFKVPLPKKVTSLRDLDSAFSVFSIGGGSERYSYFRDLLKKGEILPPFNGYAAIIGSQGYVTFDGKVYDFTSNCQHLLARDFVDGNFSLSVSYEDPNKDGVPKKSLFVSDANDVLEITHDYKVVANGKSMPTSFSLKYLNVKRDGNVLTVSRTREGFVLTCDVVTDVCVLKLDGFYFGKTLGLFGTFNHEAFDDFFKVDKKDSKNILEFTSAYKLNKQCKEKAVTAIATQINLRDSEIGQECEALFGNTRSSLKTCFDVHDPAPYLNLCHKSVARVRTTSAVQKSSLCSVVAGYKAVCQQEGVEFKYSDACPAA